MSSSASRSRAATRPAASRGSFERHGFPTLDLTDDELAKEHVRHMVGGRSELARHERLLRFIFPERPGRADALPVGHESGLEHQPVPLPQPGRRLRAHPGRHPGAGRRSRGVREFLATLAYPYIEETRNPVYTLFLR